MDGADFLISSRTVAEGVFVARHGPALRLRRTGGRGRWPELIGLTAAAVLHALLIGALALKLDHRDPPRSFHDETVTVVLAPRLMRSSPPPPVTPQSRKPAVPPPARRVAETRLVQAAPADIPTLPTVAPPPPPPAAPLARTAESVAAAAPAPSAPAETARSFRSEVLARVGRAKRYPPSARARREQGVATVAFTLDRTGRVLAASLAKGSGFAALDREAVDTVRRAQPYPALPAGLAEPYALSVAIDFHLR